MNIKSLSILMLGLFYLGHGRVMFLTKPSASTIPNKPMHITVNPWVAGSSPARGNKEQSHGALTLLGAFC
jgi:hypothetical protein